MTKKRMCLSILILGFCILFGYLFFNENYSNAVILENVTERDGYTLNLIKNKEAVEFYIKSEWIPVNGTSEKKYTIDLINKNNTIIILDKVLNNGNEIFFNFDTTYNMNANKGSFMYNGVFNGDGSFTTNASHNGYYLYNNNDEKIDIVQTAQGPNSAFGFTINPESYDLIKDGFHVSYSDFSFYEYYKN